MRDWVRFLFYHQASLSTRNSKQNNIREFARQWESKEFPREIGESTLEDNFTEARLGGKVLDFDARMHKA